MINSETIDVTVPLRKDMDVFEGDPEYSQTFVFTVDNGDGANVSRLSMSSHSGTHIDAPLHFINGAKDISEVSIQKLIGPCQVIEIKKEEMDGVCIPRSALPDKFLHKRVLFKTYMSENPGVFRRDESALSLEAAKHLNANGIELIGIDSFSVEEFNGDGSVHRELLGKEVVILETLDLSQVIPGEYSMICMPVKIVGCDASPARTLLTPL